MRILFPLAAFLLAGCTTLQNLNVGSFTGGRSVPNVDYMKVAKGVNQVRKGFSEISESEEYYIGRAVAAQVLSRYKPLNDPGLNTYAQKVTQAVALASDRPATFKGYHVQVLDSAEVNAFAAPGGFIFVTRGLLKLVKNEDELACVLAHEVAHVAKKHGLKTIQASRLTSAFTILGSEAAKHYTSQQVGQLTTAFEGAVTDVVDKLVVNGYSRDKEYEADKFGAQYAKAANYDPGALKTFLARLEKAGGATGGMFKTPHAAAKRETELGALAPGSGYKRSSERGRRFTAAVQLEVLAQGRADGAGASPCAAAPLPGEASLAVRLGLAAGVIHAFIVRALAAAAGARAGRPHGVTGVCAARCFSGQDAAHRRQPVALGGHDRRVSGEPAFLERDVADRQLVSGL